MIDLSILPLFLVSVFFLVISPGPDLLLISSYSSVRGFYAGLSISVGILIAGLIQTLLVAFGLGQLMQAMPVVALVVKLAGAAYLTWLGINLLKAWLRNDGESRSEVSAGEQSFRSLVYRGCLNNLLNPKALLFFSMFLPQFTHQQAGLIGQIMVLGILLSLVAFVVNLGFSLSFSKLGKALGQRFTLGRHIDGLLGAIFLALAARLATSK